MTGKPEFDAIIVGSGPNGLAAAITLANAGLSVKIIEAYPTIGGGCRSGEITLPGFTHDICAAVHPLGISSPFFRRIQLDRLGVRWVQPPIPLSHPLDDGTAIAVYRSVSDTAARLGRDGPAYRRLMEPLVRNYQSILSDYLGPLRVPERPVQFAGFGLLALQPAALMARAFFRDERARAVISGMAAHSILPLSRAGTAAFGLMLGMLAHAVGWPVPAQGSQVIVNALADCVRSLGGVIQTGRRVTNIADVLDQGRMVLFDTSPREVLAAAQSVLPEDYQAQLARYRYGPGVFKLDLALDGPIPWTAPECHQAGTVHLGGTMEEIVASEEVVWHGEHAERPFVLVAQPSRFDPSRAPEGKHTVWAYCHVPNGSTRDMSDVIEAQIERFAPGFRQRIIARHKRTAMELEAYNPNYVGGDINSGAQDLGQLFTRPAVRLDPYSTPDKRIFICSSAAPPGGGVHGMCGYHGARSALRRFFHIASEW